MNKNQYAVQIVLCVALAAGLWYLVFGLPDFGNFWVKLASSAALLASLSLLLMGRDRAAALEFKPQHILIGIGSAILLYGLFALGDLLMTNLFPGFAPAEIGRVYANREGNSPWVITLLLLFVTGPAEEIFWRGFLLRTLTKRMAPIAGLLVATALYALVHIWTLNLSLMLAAFTAGFAWGFIYLREQSLVPVIISHSLWGAAIFVLFPLH